MILILILCGCVWMQAFEGDEAPISVETYLERIVKYGGCSACNVTIGLMYLDRLKRKNPSVRITSRNFQRYLLVAIMESCKFFEDNYYSNKHWARIGNISCAEINELELDFLFRLSFKLNVTREEYDAFVEQIYEAVSPMTTAHTLQTCTSSDHMSSNSLADIKSRLPSCGMHRSNSECTINSTMLSGSSTPLRVASAQTSEHVQTGKGFYVAAEP